ncbi:MAG: lysophospholipase [Clostridia bacterium]|nr:lysophospholipase [Clostridia bacterium]
MKIDKISERHKQIQRDITVERYRQLNKIGLKNQIVFAGSSLAEQFPINEMLQSLNSEHIIYNRGVSGDKIDDLTGDIETLIFDLAPSKLFINIGSNDIGSEDYNEDILIEKYHMLLQCIKERLPDTIMYVLAYYPVNPNKNAFLSKVEKKFMFANRTNQNIQSINARLEKLCEQMNLAFINVYDVLLGEDGNLENNLTVEGIHLWPDAYIRIYEVLKEYF